MTSANEIEKNVSEMLEADYGMDTVQGDREIGEVAAEAYRLFPTDFMRALEYAEGRRYAVARNDQFFEAGDSDVRDRMTETLRMFCQSEESGQEPKGNPANGHPVGYRFSMALSPAEINVMISMIDADADNERDKGEDEGLRAELGASLKQSLELIDTDKGGAVIMMPGELDLIAMLTDNWLESGAECISSVPDDVSEEDEVALRQEVEATLKALHSRLIPAHNPIIVL